MDRPVSRGSGDAGGRPSSRGGPGMSMVGGGMRPMTGARPGTGMKQPPTPPPACATPFPCARRSAASSSESLPSISPVSCRSPCTRFRPPRAASRSFASSSAQRATVALGRRRSRGCHRLRREACGLVGARAGGGVLFLEGAAPRLGVGRRRLLPVLRRRHCLRREARPAAQARRAARRADGRGDALRVRRLVLVCGRARHGRGGRVHVGATGARRFKPASGWAATRGRQLADRPSVFFAVLALAGSLFI